MNYVKKVWGYEDIIVNNEKFCAKFLVIRKSCQTSLHYHMKKDETFYVMEGVAIVLFSGAEREVEVETVLQPGDKIDVNHGTVHRVAAPEGDIKILEISTHHEDSDSIRLENGGKIEE